MIRKKTVFILGAGASCEYGFPLGSQLRSAIIALALDERCPDDATEALRDVWNALWSDRDDLLQVYYSDKRLKDFGKSFMRSGTYSIDTFLKHRPEQRPIGAALIGLIISHCERQDLLFRQPRLYNWLADRMGPTAEDPTERKVTFVTFNYDRSLECFMMLSTRELANDPAKANAELDPGQIIHMHGSVGDMPHIGPGYKPGDPVQAYERWNELDSNVRYGEHDIARWQKTLRLVGERASEEANKMHQQARHAIAQAQVVCFLGFGFDKENMKLLSFPYRPGYLHDPRFIYQGKQVSENPVAIGTALGLTASRRKEVARMLFARSFYDSAAELLRFDLQRTCGELLDDNIQTLDAEWDLPKA
ncbi:MAG: hypothetical protein NCW75_11765 [Phycisphaera sp.]|nr:MAG: hypothetical protein NCW75_11765 [Phycisphaera sp.]